MTPETPATGIMKMSDYGNAKFYKIDCECGNNDDQIVMEVEADEDDITVHVWTIVKTNWWDETWRKRYDIDSEILQDMHWFAVDLLNGIVNKCKLTWNIWVNGYIKQESWTMLNEQQALNFAETIKSAINDVKQFKEGSKNE